MVEEIGKGVVMRVRKGLLVLALFASMLALSGCDLLMKKAVENATGVKVDQNQDGKVTVTTKNGEQTSVSGTEGTLPDGLPDSVPVYKGEIVGKSAAMQTAQGATYLFTVKTSDDIATVVAWEKKTLPEKGWTITVEQTTAESAIVSAKMGEKTQVTITVKKGSAQATEISTMSHFGK